MADAIGLTLIKLNGVFELDALNLSTDVDRAVVQHVTAGGVKEALGVPIPVGGCDEIISKSGATDWTTLSDFRVDIYDQETRSIIVHSTSGNNWAKLSTSSDLASAVTKKKIQWKGTTVNKV